MASPLWSVAWRELRRHPGRYIATLLAIAISVGFLAAASTITATEGSAMGRQMAAPYTKADLVVAVNNAPDSLTTGAVTKSLKATPGVAAVEPLASSVLVFGDGVSAVMVQAYELPSPSFRWAGLSDGRWPESAGEVALNRATAKTLKVGLGSVIPAGEGKSWRVVGLTDEGHSSLGSDNAYVAPGGLFEGTTVAEQLAFGQRWLVLVADDMASVQNALQNDLVTLQADGTVRTGSVVVKSAMQDALSGINAFKYILGAFAVIALVVGAITVSNTFTILLVQRRRQIGLLRCVGATATQVRRSVWCEALLLGLAGSLLGLGLAAGLTAIVAAVTGSLAWGITLPGSDLLVTLGVGLVITVLACAGPARRALQVPVLQAMQPGDASVAGVRRAPVRAAFCGLALALGVLLCVAALRSSALGEAAFVVALGGAALVSLGVLFGAPFFVPALLRATGGLTRHFGPSAAVAAKNVVRDPNRASATATALMLAIGLVVTLQVGAASTQATVNAKIAAAYPVDLWAQGASNTAAGTLAPVPTQVRQKLAELPGGTTQAALTCRLITITDDKKTAHSLPVCRYDTTIAQAAPGQAATIDDGTILVPKRTDYPADGSTVTLPGSNGKTMTLQAAASKLALQVNAVFLSPASYDAIGGAGTDGFLVLIGVPGRSDITGVMKAFQDAVRGSDGVSYGGALDSKYTLDQVLGIIVSVMTGLLAVAVLIALVGVGNTLTLSVLERRRESAILRALGFRRRQLRAMLLAEALQLTLVAGIIGAGFGAFFGWLGTVTLTRQIDDTTGTKLPTVFAIDWGQTMALLGVLVLAAGLASLLPGRRAAEVSPVEALADVG